MAGRPQRKLLENKPMPESPKIVKAAKAALASVPAGTRVSIAVPWEDFVFSTREGKTYMPPTIRKGIEHARSEGYNNIKVHLTQNTAPHPDRHQGDFDSSGTFDNGYFINIYPEAHPSTLRHELVHLVQEVGSELIKTSTGWAQKHTAFGKRRVNIPSEGDQRRRTIFGGPKNELRALKKGKRGIERYQPRGTGYGQRQLAHPEREIELHANALTDGVAVAQSVKEALSVSRSTRKQKLTYLIWQIADLRRPAYIIDRALREAYVMLVWQTACRELGLPDSLEQGDKNKLMPWRRREITPRTPRKPGMFVAGKRVKGAALEAHREVVAKRPPKVRPFTVPVPVPAPAPGVRYTSKGQPFIMADGRARFIKKNPLGARLNPLVKWDRQYEGTVGSGDYYYGPILKADAEEKFRAGLATSDRVMKARGFSPLPLSFVVRAAVPFGSPEEAEKLACAKRLGAETKSVVLIEDIYGRAVGRATKPGDSTRETPHTMFNALHRLCELIASPGESVDGKLTTSIAGLRTGDISFLPCMSEAVSNNFYTAAQMMMAAAEELAVERGADPERRSSTSPYVRALFSSGLSTASGRLGAIDDPDQSLAEAFAKWCLSGEDLYLPESPILLDNKHLILREHERDRIQAIREIWSQTLSTTVAAIARVFTMYVTAYYTDVIPVLQTLSDNPIFMVLTYEFARDKIRNSGLHFQFPVSFMRPRAHESAQYANELYLATRELFRGPSREEEQQAYTVVQMAWHDLRDLPELIELKRRIKAGQDREKYAFLKERYSKPRNTPQSISKSKKILAALEVLSAAKRHRPGLWGAFIQPNE